MLYKANNKQRDSQKAVIEATPKYTQLIQFPKKATNANKQGFHISTVPNNTSSLFNIYLLKLIKFKCVLLKLHKSFKNTRIRTWLV